MLVDSHCHIDGEAFDEDLDAVIERAREAGVTRMLNVGTGDPRSDDFRRAVALAEKYEGIYASVGVHPHDAKLYDDKAENHLIELARNSQKVIAWGEIGLDFYYDHSPRDVQKEVFRRQIKTARSLGLPVIIHSRDANDETVEILTQEFADNRDIETSQQPEIEKAGSWKLEADSWDLNTGLRSPAVSRQPGILHCFGGTPEMAKVLMDIGFLISFAGNVTFKKAENLRESARVVPIEKMLVETDCPFLTPIPFRGKRNEPSYVVHTAKFLAELKGVAFETLAEQTTKNFLNLFGLRSTTD